MTLTFNQTKRDICFIVELENVMVVLEGTETFLLKLVNPVSADVSDVKFSGGDTAMVIISDVNGKKVWVCSDFYQSLHLEQPSYLRSTILVKKDCLIVTVL